MYTEIATFRLLTAGPQQAKRVTVCTTLKKAFIIKVSCPLIIVTRMLFISANSK